MVRNPEPPLLPAWGSANDVLMSVFAAEACIPFFEVYTTILIGNKKILNVLLNKFQPTDGERAAAEKLLECYNESGLEGKFLNAKVLVMSSLP